MKLKWTLLAHSLFLHPLIVYNNYHMQLPHTPLKFDLRGYPTPVEFFVLSLASAIVVPETKEVVIHKYKTPMVSSLFLLMLMLKANATSGHAKATRSVCQYCTAFFHFIVSTDQRCSMKSMFSRVWVLHVKSLKKKKLVSIWIHISSSSSRIISNH